MTTKLNPIRPNHPCVSGAPETFFCYLLRSINPDHKNVTYIGFTTNPLRRLRQHNREISGGAKRTCNKGPWEMVLCIYGFPHKIAALQFEYAWTYPADSRLARRLIEKRGKKYGLRTEGRIELLYGMVQLLPWRKWNLHIRYLQEDSFNVIHQLHFTKTKSMQEDKKNIPPHMSITWGDLKELEWFTSLKPLSKSSNSDLVGGPGDTIGEEPVGLHVARFKSKKPDEEEEPEEKKAESQPPDDDDEDDGEILDEDEQDHAPIEDVPIDLPHHMSIPASAEIIDVDGPVEVIDVDDLAMQEELDSFGFRYDDASNSFVVLSDDEDCGVMHGGADLDEEEEIDMTVEEQVSPTAARNSPAPSTTVPAAVSSSTSVVTPALSRSASTVASTAASSTVPTVSLRPSKKSSCNLCHTVPATPPGQVTAFGFHNLMSVCPHCLKSAHLLCFQQHMQQLQPMPTKRSNSPLVRSASISSATATVATTSSANSIAASSAASTSTLPSLPLIPEPAPCPFCQHTLIWCHLVDNCHRFHAPTATPTVAATGPASIPSNARTINQYLIDAGKKFRRILFLMMAEARKKHLEDKAAKAKAKREATTTSSTSAAAYSFHRPEYGDDNDDDKENQLPASQPSNSRLNRKRRSRSAEPAGECEGGFIVGSQESSQEIDGLNASPQRPPRSATKPKPSRPTRSISVPESPSIVRSILNSISSLLNLPSAPSLPSNPDVVEPPAKKKRTYTKRVKPSTTGSDSESSTTSQPKLKNPRKPRQPKMVKSAAAASSAASSSSMGYIPEEEDPTASWANDYDIGQHELLHEEQMQDIDMTQQQEHEWLDEDTRLALVRSMSCY